MWGEDAKDASGFEGDGLGLYTATGGIRHHSGVDRGAFGALLDTAVRRLLQVFMGLHLCRLHMKELLVLRFFPLLDGSTHHSCLELVLTDLVTRLFPTQATVEWV